MAELIYMKVYVDWRKLLPGLPSQCVEDNLLPNYQHPDKYKFAGVGSDGNGDYIIMKTDNPQDLTGALLGNEAVLKIKLPYLPGFQRFV